MKRPEFLLRKEFYFSVFAFRKKKVSFSVKKNKYIVKLPKEHTGDKIDEITMELKK